MYGVALGLAGSEPKNVYERVAVGLLRKLSSSPAGIFVPGSGYLQALDNKLTWSKDLTGAGWTNPSGQNTIVSGYAGVSGAATAQLLTTPLNFNMGHANAVVASGQQHTVYFLAKAGSSPTSGIETNGAASGTLVFTHATKALSAGGSFTGATYADMGNGWYLVAAQTGATSTTSLGFFVYGNGSYVSATGSSYFDGFGVSQGSYTAQQIASLGIPWTMATASVSLSLGPELASTANSTLSNTTGYISGMNTAPVVSKNYWVGYNYSLSSGQVQAGSGSSFTTGTAQAGPSSGYYSYAAVGNGTNASFALYANAATGSVSNFSVREILSVACPVYTDAHVYLPGSTVTSYWANIAPAIDNTWSVTNAGWGNVGSTAVATAVPDGNAFYKTGVVTTGKTYQYTLTVSSISAGAMLVYVGGNGDGKTITSPGTLTGTIQATLNTNVNIGNSGTTTGVVSSLVLREVITTSTPISGLLSNNYTLSDGSSGYSAIDGTAGLVLDGAGSVGAELVTNGDFSAGTTGWTTIQMGWSISGGAASVNSSGAGSTYLRQGTSVVGATYKITLTVTAYTSGSIYLVVGGTLSGTPITSTGTYTYYLNATDTTGFGVYGQSTTAIATVDNVSCVQVTGIHATQATTANKPMLNRGLYNLLTYSNTFSDASWNRFNSSITATGVDDPFGGTSAVTLTASSAGGEVLKQPSATTGVTYTSAIWIRRRAGSGTVSITRADGLAWVTISVTSQWALYTNVQSSSGGIGGGVQLATSGDAVDICFAGVFLGTLTAAQILAEGGIPLTTSTAASNSGAGRYSWQFDGSNDSLALGSVPFQMSDDHCVVVGFRPNAGNIFVVGITNAGGTTMCGNLRLASDGHLSAWWKDDVAAQSLIYGPSNVIGATLVASAQKVGNVKSLRSNGTQVATDSTVLGTTTLTNANIGSLASVGGFMDGSIGPVILIKGTVSDADLLTLERWVAANTLGAPSF